MSIIISSTSTCDIRKSYISGGKRATGNTGKKDLNVRVTE